MPDVYIAIRDADHFLVKFEGTTYVVPVQDIPSDVEMWLPILEKKKAPKENRK